MNSYEERRRFVRVDDRLNLHVTLLGQKSYRPAGRGLQDNFGHRFNALENKLKMLLPRQQDKHTELLEIFSVLNEKLNLLAEEFSKEESTIEGATLVDVSLSACGVGFPSKDPAVLDENVWIEMELQPEMVKVSALAKVIGTEKNTSDENGRDYYLRVDFLDLSLDDEEALIQHVVRRQSQWLREQRQQREISESKDNSSNIG